jgi:hypothetical protein
VQAFLQARKCVGTPHASAWHRSPEYHRIESVLRDECGPKLEDVVRFLPGKFMFSWSEFTGCTQCVLQVHPSDV